MVEQAQGGVLHWRVFALTGCSACVGAALQAHNPCWPPLHATLLSKDFTENSHVNASVHNQHMQYYACRCQAVASVPRSDPALMAACLLLRVWLR
jgi:hypothetical protein